MADSDPMAVVERLLDLLQAHDLDSAYELVADDAEYIHAGVRGRAAIRAFDEAAFDMFPDHTRRIVKSVKQGDTVAVLIEFEGTHQPSGMRLSIPVVSVFRVQDGKVVSSWQIADEQAVTDQMAQLAQ